MILNLSNFGKFKNISFEISKNITLFYGENESGKTTIFDALMSMFSENKKTSSFAKQIKVRYGDEAECSLNPEIDSKIKLHPEAYGNLYAIRQSEILFNITDGKKDSKDWQEEIKIKLFSSDIDIGKLISEIKSEYAGKSQNSIPQQTILLNNNKNNIEKELEKLYITLKARQNKKEKIESLEEEYIVIKNEIEKKIEISESIKKILNLKKKSSNKQKKIETMTLINRLNKINEFLKQNDNLKKDYLEEINVITEKINEYEKRIPYLVGKIETIKKQEGNKQNIDYESIKIRVENSIKKLNLIEQKSNKMPKIVFMCSVIIASVILSISLKNLLWFLMIIPALPFMFIKDTGKKNENYIKEIIENLPEIKLDTSNINALKDSLTKELIKIELLLSQNNKEEITQYENEYNEMVRNIEENKTALSKLFNFLNVSSKENYISIKKDYNDICLEKENIYKKLAEEAKRMSLKDFNMLETEILRELKELDEEGITPDLSLNDTEIKIKEKEYENITEDINFLKDKLSSVKENISYLKGEIEDAHNIHKKITELESNTAKIETEIINIQKRKKALIMLEKMFETLNEKNNDVFVSLTEDAKTLYSHITKNISENGALIMEGFDKNKISVLDKQNEKRDIELLSSATKDAVYISMRLAILRKVHEDGRIILLDDPFITFDEKRVYEALVFIKEFSKEYNIPVVMFTKDVFIRNIMKDFKEATIHELS